jgi:uncharacterized protein YukE
VADFVDTMNPPGRLTPPGDYEQQVLDSTRDAMGILKYIDEVFQKIVGWSPGKEFVDWIGGNWGQLLSLRDAWNCVSFSMSDIGDNLQAGRTELAPHWDGNAAQSFEAYMVKWVQAFEQDQQAAAAVRDKLNDLAENAKQTVDMIIAAIKEIWALITSAGASIEIPVWGEYKIVRAVWEAIKLINSVRKVVGVFVSTVHLAVEFFQAIAEMLDDRSPTLRVDVPTGAYGGPANPGN